MVNNEEILKFFNYKNLPANLQEVAIKFHLLAEEMNKTLPPYPEKTAGFRKLLKAKDCFVRATL